MKYKWGAEMYNDGQKKNQISETDNCMMARRQGGTSVRRLLVDADAWMSISLKHGHSLCLAKHSHHQGEARGPLAPDDGPFT